MPQREEHTGIIRDNDDPQQRGRLLVECPTIVSGETIGDWVEPTFDFIDSSQSAGSFWVPNIGSMVSISIEAEEDSEVTGLDPRWECAVYPVGTVPEEFLTNYPNRRGWVTKAGHILIFDDTENQVEFYYKHPSGAEIRVTNDGQIQLSPPAGQSVLIGADADEPLVLGQKLSDFFNDGMSGLSYWLDTHVHPDPVTGTTGVPTGSSPTFGSDILSEDNKVK